MLGPGYIICIDLAPHGAWLCPHNNYFFSAPLNITSVHVFKCCTRHKQDCFSAYLRCNHDLAIRDNNDISLLQIHTKLCFPVHMNIAQRNHDRGESHHILKRSPIIRECMTKLFCCFVYIYIFAVKSTKRIINNNSFYTAEELTIPCYLVNPCASRKKNIARITENHNVTSSVEFL